MPPKRLNEEQIAALKFEDCRVCKFVLSKRCRGCDAGEYFEDAETPEATDSFMRHPH